MAGRVIFVSAGPGAADLITLRGARALGQADVVLADALADPALRDLAPQARWISVGKRGFEHSAKQTEINAQLVKAAQEHNLVVRLKGGDASVFGRLEEELIALAEAGIASEVVPGVTAALAAAAQAQRPLTRRGRGRSVSLTTAMTEAGELRATLSADTEVFYMAGRQLAALARQLLAAGWAPDTPARTSHARRCCTAAVPPSSRWAQAQVLSEIRNCLRRSPIKSLFRPQRRPLLLRAAHDPCRHRSLHPLQVHRLRRRLPGRLLPRRPQLPDHRPRRVHRLRGLHPRVPGQRDHAGGGRAR
jgi:uroporphyrin-III C-methyltransferase